MYVGRTLVKSTYGPYRVRRKDEVTWQQQLTDNPRPRSMDTSYINWSMDEVAMGTMDVLAEERPRTETFSMLL